MIQDLPTTPSFLDADLKLGNVQLGPEAHEDAVWDVFFTRLSGIQEYGFHSGIETLIWATDQLNGSLTDLDWCGLSQELTVKSPEWTELIIRHATDEGAFFPPRMPWEEYDQPEAF